MKSMKSNDGLPIIDLASYIPDGVKGMTVLDKTLFTTTIDAPVVRCQSKICGKVQKEFKNCLFNRPHFRKILPCEGSGQKERLVLLHTSISSEDHLSDTQKEFLKANGCSFQLHRLKLDYRDFSFDEILKKILPEDTKEIVTSFETVGHIAHLNLKPVMLEYKHLVGEVLLDKNKHIKTVVNKTNSIEETFRFFKMELLAGDDKMKTTVHEHGCVFEFDYSKVYWNSRLQTEHQRIVNLVNADDVVFDVFAGVGPFSIPIAKKVKKVYANDLNIESYNALKHNAELNKVSDKIITHNCEGREFLDKIVIEDYICQMRDCDGQVKNMHIIMNLPAIAPEFLDVFSEKYKIFDLPVDVHPNIFIHCYCFCKSEHPEEECVVRINEILHVDISPTSKVHFVRRVAPNKVMMCVTFNLTWFKHNIDKCSCNSHPKKRHIEGELHSGGTIKKSRIE